MHNSLTESEAQRKQMQFSWLNKDEMGSVDALLNGKCSVASNSLLFSKAPTSDHNYNSRPAADAVRHRLPLGLV